MDFWQGVGVASVTSLLTWIGFSLNAAHTRRNEKDRALEAEKRDTYKRLMSLLFDVLRSSKQISKQQKLIDDLEMRFFEVARDMTIYASDDVLSLWLKFKTMGDSPSANFVLALIGELMSSIRVDLGHMSGKFDAKELLSTFITDIDSMELPSVR